MKKSFVSALCELLLSRGISILYLLICVLICVGFSIQSRNNSKVFDSISEVILFSRSDHRGRKKANN